MFRIGRFLHIQICPVIVIVVVVVCRRTRRTKLHRIQCLQIEEGALIFATPVHFGAIPARVANISALCGPMDKPEFVAHINKRCRLHPTTTSSIATHTKGAPDSQCLLTLVVSSEGWREGKRERGRKRGRNLPLGYLRRE